MKKYIFIFGVLIGITLPCLSFAALDLVNVNTSPKTPGENQDVTISLDSFSSDLNSSEIIWYLNKSPIKQGIGEKSVMIHTGELGQSQHLTAVILTNLGARIEKNITITPAEIDFLWEAQTYTPPFYKGKAIPTYKSLVKVTAIPRYGQTMSDPKTFMYDWKYNRTLSVGQGLGKNSALIRMGFADTPMPVSVDVSLPSGNWTGNRSENISGGEAQVRFYQQAPLLGINFNKELKESGASDGNQFTLKAVPYFFSNEDVADGVLIYTWTANNSNILPGLDPTILSLTKQGNTEEQQKDQKFTVRLKIQTPRHLLQEGGRTTVIDLPEEIQ